MGKVAKEEITAMIYLDILIWEHETRNGNFEPIFGYAV